MNYFKRVKAILMSPTRFFESIAHQRSYKESAIFLVISTLLASVLSEMAFAFFPPLGADIVAPSQTVGSFLLWTVIFAATVVPITFIFAAIAHLFVKLFKGSGDLQQTFKVFAYSSAGVVFYVIPYIGLFVGELWGLGITIQGFKKLHSLSSLKAILTLTFLLMASVLLFIALSIIFGIIFGLAVPF
jgi:hypothetical protein